MNQNWKRFICTALVLILAFMGPMVDSSLLGKYIKSDTTQVLATTAKEKKKQAEDDLDNTNNKINDIKDQKATVDSSIKSKSDELDSVLAAQKKLQTDIADKQSQIEDNMVELDSAKQQQQEQYDAMKQRIQFMYENSSDDNLWTAIIEADGISDMLNRIEYVSDIYTSDRDLLESYQQAVQHVQEVGDQLNKDMEDLNDLQDQYEAQQSELETKIAELKDTSDQYQSQLAEAQQQAENYKSIISTQGEIIRQQEAAAAAEAARQAREQQEAADRAAAQAAAAQAAANSSSSSNDSASSSDDSSGSYDGGGAGAGGLSGDNADLTEDLNPSTSSSTSGSEVVAYAEQFVGGRYVWGGNSLTDGVDCSGFVHEVYEHFGISTPRYSQAFKSVGQAVSFNNIQPGDVVVYPGHVAIYAGGGRIVEAQSTRAGITDGRSVQCHTILAIRRLL